MELTGRQKKLLITAFETDTDSQHRFDYEKVGTAAKMSPAEALDTVTVLRRSFEYVDLAPNFAKSYDPLTGREEPPDDPGRTLARLTVAGREAARHLLDERRAKRRGYFWKAGAIVWGVVISISVPVTANWLNRKIERIENERTTTRPMAAPVTAPPSQSATAPMRAPASQP